MTNSNISVKRYLGLFFLLYLCIIVIFAILRINGMSFQPVTGVFSVGVICYITAFKFVKDNKRAPTKHERNKLTIGSFLVICIPFIFSFLRIVTSEPSLGQVVISLSFLTLYYIVLFIIYGHEAGKIAKKIKLQES